MLLPLSEVFPVEAVGAADENAQNDARNEGVGEKKMGGSFRMDGVLVAEEVADDENGEDEEEDRIGAGDRKSLLRPVGMDSPFADEPMA